MPFATTRLNFIPGKCKIKEGNKLLRVSDEEHFHTERSTQQSHGGELDHFDIHYWSKVKQMVGPLINYTAASIANYSP